ncbi:MAG: DsbA family protein [Pseudomonadota bacterium]
MTAKAHLRRLFLFAAAALWLSAPAGAFDLEAMSDTERAAFGEQVRAYLLENPEVIMEAVRVLEDREAQAQALADIDLVKQNAKQLFEDPTSWVGGNPDGDLTLVEFIDYRCGFCRRAAPEVDELLARDGNIKVIVKEFPILGEQSTLASRFAISVRQNLGDDAYKSVHDTLIAFNGDVTEAALRRIGESMGLPIDKIIADMDGAAVTDVIETNLALGQDLRINGTPTFVMGDQMLRGFLSAEEMLQVAQSVRAR